MLRSKMPGEQQREFSTLSTITDKKDNYIEIPTRSFDIEEPEEDSEEYRHRLISVLILYLDIQYLIII